MIFTKDVVTKLIIAHYLEQLALIGCVSPIGQ